MNCLPKFVSSCFRRPDEAAALPLALKGSPSLNAPNELAGAACARTVPTQANSGAPDSPSVNAFVSRGKDNPNALVKANEARPSDCVELRPYAQQPEPRSRVEYTTADNLVKDVQDLRWLGQGAQGVVYEGCWQGATVAVKFSIVEDLDTTAYELLFSRLLSHPNVVQTFVAKVAVLDEKTIYSTNPETSISADYWRAAAHEPRNPPSSRHRGEPSAATGPGPGATATCSALYKSSAGGPAAAGVGQDGCSSSRALNWPGHPAAARLAAAGGGGGGTSAGGGSNSLRTGSPAGTRGFELTTASSDLSKLVGFGAGGALATRGDSFHSDDGFGDPFGRRSTFTDVREVLASMGAKPGHYITQMVMEHCDHGSLHAAIQRGIFKPASRWGPKLALRALIRTVREVAQGMFHLHSNNVLHGDLKPANVLLINSRKDRRGYIAKVSDFGLAQFCCQDHISNAPWGTLVYMAPERLLHGQLFPASDVYSFGVMLWEMYHGQRPYEGMHVAQIVMACAQGANCLEWMPDACEDIVRISRRCTAQSPHDRPTFESLMRELAHLEARVRLEGPRISTSYEAGGASSCGAASAGASTSQLRRAATAGNPGRQSTESVAAATAGAIATGGRRSHEVTTGGMAAPGRARLSTDASCRPSLHPHHHPQHQHHQHSSHPHHPHQQQHACSARHPGSASGPIRGSPPPNCDSTGASSRFLQPPQPQPPRSVMLAPEPPPLAPPAPAPAPVPAPAPATAVTGPPSAPRSTLVDSEAGRRSGGSSAAAAIATALAAQPAIASAVVSELLARLPAPLQQQQQQQPPQLTSLSEWHLQPQQLAAGREPHHDLSSAAASAAAAQQQAAPAAAPAAAPTAAPAAAAVAAPAAATVAGAGMAAPTALLLPSQAETAAAGWSAGAPAAASSPHGPSAGGFGLAAPAAGLAATTAGTCAGSGCGVDADDTSTSPHKAPQAHTAPLPTEPTVPPLPLPPSQLRTDPLQHHNELAQSPDKNLQRQAGAQRAQAAAAPAAASFDAAAVTADDGNDGDMQAAASPVATCRRGGCVAGLEQEADADITILPASHGKGEACPGEDQSKSPSLPQQSTTQVIRAGENDSRGAVSAATAIQDDRMPQSPHLLHNAAAAATPGSRVGRTSPQDGSSSWSLSAPLAGMQHPQPAPPPPTHAPCTAASGASDEELVRLAVVPPPFAVRQLKEEAAAMGSGAAATSSSSAGAEDGSPDFWPCTIARALSSLAIGSPPSSPFGATAAAAAAGAGGSRSVSSQGVGLGLLGGSGSHAVLDRQSSGLDSGPCGQGDCVAATLGAVTGQGLGSGSGLLAGQGSGRWGASPCPAPAAVVALGGSRRRSGLPPSRRSSNISRYCEFPTITEEPT